MSVLIRKILRDIWRGKATFAAAALVVMLGVLTLGASYASYSNLLRSYQHAYDVLHFADFVASTPEPPSDLPERVRAIPGVRAVEARLVGELPALAPDGQTRGAQARLISLPTPQRPAVNDVMVYAGATISDPTSPAVLLESSFAEYYDLHPGDQVQVVGTGEVVTLPIAGLVKTAEYILPVPSAQSLLPSPRSFAVLYTPSANAQRLLQSSHAFNELAVTVDQEASRSEVIRRLRGIAGEGVVTKVVVQEDQASHATLQLDLEGFREMALLFPAIFFGAAAFTLYIILGRMVRAQTPLIGLMRAVGYGSGAVVQHYLSYALVIGLVGAAVGSLLGFLLGGAMTQVYTQFVNVPVVWVEPEWGAIGLGAAGAVAVCLAAVLVPALRAARIQPAQAMRGDRAASPPRGLHIGRRLPMPLRLGLRNALRSPWRSLATGAVIAVAAMLVVVTLGSMDSMNDLMEHEFDSAFSYDAMVYFSQPVPASLAEQVAELPGVQTAEAVIQIPVELRHGEERFASMLLGVADDATLTKVYDLDRQPVRLGDGLAVAAGLRGRLELAPGDELELTTPIGSVTLRVDRFVASAMGSLVYARLDRIQEVFGAPNVITGITTTIDPNAVDATTERLRALPFATQVEVTGELRESMEELLDFAFAFIGVMIVLAALLAFAVVFNTITVTVMERQRELATMRMMGWSLRRVATILTVENLLVVVPGVLVGLSVGRVLANPVTQLFNSELFYLDRVVVQPLGVALVGLGLVAVALLALGPSVRHVGSLSLADVAREQTG